MSKDEGRMNKKEGRFLIRAGYLSILTSGVLNCLDLTILQTLTISIGSVLFIVDLLFCLDNMASSKP